MKTTRQVEQGHSLRWRIPPYARILAWTVAVIVAVASSGRGYTTYSGTSVGTNGTVYGWGVTDATPPPGSGMTHTAYVLTILRSPKGRTASTPWINGVNIRRGDVSLPWDATDLGTYTDTSSHKFYCVVLGWVVLGTTQGSGPVPYVTLTLRTSGEVSSDNSARGEYNFRLGTYGLGTFRCAGHNVDCPVWVTGVEVKGQVSPSTFTGSIIFRRRIIKSITYNNTVEDPAYTKTDEMDGYEAAYQDQNPQSGGSAGKVYDWDAPGTGNKGSAEVGHIRRKRSNYREWAELTNGMKVSGDLYWYSRLSVYKSQSGGDLLKTDISGDNVAGMGSTKTTWNLQ